MNQIIKLLLVLKLYFLGITIVFGQNIKDFIPQIITDDIVKSNFLTDDTIEDLNNYKNIPSTFHNFHFEYLYIDPVQGVYEKLMLETNQPERWQKFKTRFSVPESLISSEILLNNKLVVFYALDSNQNTVIIIDENGNKDLSDDEILYIDKSEIGEKRINISIPVKLYDRKNSELKDSIISLGVFAEFRSNPQTTTKDIRIKFYNTSNLNVKISAKNRHYNFSWIPPLSQNRIFISSILPLRLNVSDEYGQIFSSELHTIGDTIIIDNIKYSIKQFDSARLRLEELFAEDVGYSIGQTFKPISGIDIFNLDREIEITSKKYLVIDFWGTWCAPCISAMPELVDFEKKYRDQVNVISIVYDGTDKVDLAKKIIKEKNLSWPQIWDDKSNSKIIKIMKIQALPTFIVIDKNKKIVLITSGMKSLNAFMNDIG